MVGRGHLPQRKLPTPCDLSLLLSSQHDVLPQVSPAGPVQGGRARHPHARTRGEATGSEGSAARKRTVAACTQCCGSSRASQHTPDPVRPGRDETGRDAGDARSVIPCVRPPACCVQYADRSSDIAAIGRLAFHECTQLMGSPYRHQIESALLGRNRRNLSVFSSVPKRFRRRGPFTPYSASSFSQHR